MLLYLVRLADVLEIDLPSAARSKLAASAQRFPVEQVRAWRQIGPDVGLAP